MKLIHTLTIASAVLGLAGTSMAGSSAAAPATCSPDAFNPWNVELSLLHQRARANQLSSADNTDGVRLAVSYQASPEAWGIRGTYDEIRDFNSGSSTDFHTQRFTLEGFKTGLQLGAVDCSYSAGLRYMTIASPDGGHNDGEADLLGPVVGFDVSYALPYNFSLYGNSEFGYVWATEMDSTGYGEESHDYIWSVGWGVRYDITFCPALEGAYVKVGYEVNRYEDLAESNSAKVAGWVIGVGYSF